ncbi:hypothetical protein AWB76_07175 [Caballeronia temeraria]|uniref:Uncharacterized protein n=1 Tax=Caballeronia temeraria TaxID=1777137 RepID=A0A158DM90_9BURK|nr:hypothetical protein AWB76_07175 [Caballeronia temeraria]
MNDLSPYTFGPTGFKRDRESTLETITIPLSTYKAMQRKIAYLEHQANLDSWRTNPDRMGS